METAYSLVFVTAKGPAEARKIQEALVKERLAACAKVLSGIHSCFSWKGKVEKAEESLLIIETKTSLLDRLFKRVRELHSYEVPAISAVPLLKGNSGYLRWIDEATG